MLFNNACPKGKENVEGRCFKQCLARQKRHPETRRCRSIKFKKKLCKLDEKYDKFEHECRMIQTPFNHRVRDCKEQGMRYDKLKDGCTASKKSLVESRRNKVKLCKMRGLFYDSKYDACSTK